jgi:hypothetical protein
MGAPTESPAPPGPVPDKAAHAALAAVGAAGAHGRELWDQASDRGAAALAARLGIVRVALREGRRHLPLDPYAEHALQVLIGRWVSEAALAGVLRDTARSDVYAQCARDLVEAMAQIDKMIERRTP